MAASPVRMEPIATLPVFLKLGGKRAIIAGGTAPAVWKAELLSAAGAHVEVFAADPDDALVALAASPPGGPIALVRRAWDADDIAGAAVALGAIEDDEEGARFQQAARRAGVPVNVIDKPAFCDFQFGTIVARSPLVIGISTDGAAPVFGQAIRARIEALLPQSLTSWAEAARDWRPRVQALNLDFRARRRFWESFAEAALAGSPDAPTASVFEAGIAATRGAAAGAELARRVVLVGSGEGAPDGITLRAVKALQDADEVFYPAGLTSTLVAYARREAVKVELSRTWTASETLDRVADTVAGARRHVWLDRGNPSVCTRWREREVALAERGIAVTLVDGLGRCEDCGPGCLAWDTRLGQTSSAAVSGLT